MPPRDAVIQADYGGDDGGQFRWYMHRSIEAAVHLGRFGTFFVVATRATGTLGDVTWRFISIQGDAECRVDLHSSATGSDYARSYLLF